MSFLGLREDLVEVLIDDLVDILNTAFARNLKNSIEKYAIFDAKIRAKERENVHERAFLAFRSAR